MNGLALVFLLVVETCQQQHQQLEFLWNPFCAIWIMAPGDQPTGALAGSLATWAANGGRPSGSVQGPILQIKHILRRRRVKHVLPRVIFYMAP